MNTDRKYTCVRCHTPVDAFATILCHACVEATNDYTGEHLTMDTYSKYRPTGFDTSGLGLEDRQSWLVVPVGQNRDSGCLAKSNFMTALDILGGESDTCEVHRFGHWGVGWFEIIIVHPSREHDAQEIQDRLEEYPVLSDEHHSQLEYEAACEYWESMRVKDRVEWCQRYDVSIFAARRDSIPEGIEISALAE